MAMDKDVLKDLILSKLEEARETPDFQNGDAREKGEVIWGAIADAIITHIQTDAQITFRTSDAEIQKSTAPGDPTDPPDDDVTLDAGQIS